MRNDTMNRQNAEVLKATFTANGQRCAVTVTIGTVENEAKKDIDLQAVPAGAPVLSITGECAGSAGQCTDSLRRLREGCPDVERLCDIWDRYHLNAMRAASRAQSDFLGRLPNAPTDHDSRVCLLKAAGLHPSPYAYGSAWLYEPVPAEVWDELRAIVGRLDGADVGAAPDLDSLPDVDEGADTLDSRDVVERYEGYRLAVVAMGLDPDNVPYSACGSETVAEYLALRELNNAGSCYVEDWNFGATLVADGHFTEYAEELARDIGAVNGDAQWPNNHIDWEAAGEDLKADYTAIEFKGARFWVR